MRIAHVLAAPSNKFASNCDGDFSWREMFRDLFPENTAAYVASFTRTSVGAAEHVLRGRNGPSGRALVNLLRSPAGPRVLDAIAGETDWRRVERRLISLYELEQELHQLEQKRRELAGILAVPGR